MPGNSGSPFWATVDFDSEGSDVPSPPPMNRLYLDPWDNEAYGVMPVERTESSQGDNFNSFAGEPVSASFYYVPTKNYDSGEEPPLPPPRRNRVNEEVTQEHIYGRRKSSRIAVTECPEALVYSEKPLRDRRRSMHIEEPIYVPHPMIYEPLYGPAMPPPGYMPPPPMPRMSVAHHPDYVIANIPHPQSRSHSRMMEAYEQFAYESLSPEYEDWARPYPKTVPDNFHLSRYGHLRIDYSCSWNSLDRLIRNQ